MALPLRMAARYYGSSAKDPSEVVSSTSGGVASVLSRTVIRRGGLVFGAAFDPFPTVRHIAVDNENELARLKGSKYVESDIKTALRGAVKAIRDGRETLFIGLPCYVAALYAVLGRDYDNLITVDLICHGKPPQRLFTHWVAYLQRKMRCKIHNYWFRTKRECGWNDARTYQHYIQTDDGRILLIPKKMNWYVRYFLGGSSFMEGCYHCPFAKIPRVGDITLGDFWGIEHDPRFIDLIEKGVSFVSVQSSKGMDLLGQCQNDLVSIPVDADFAVQSCYHLTHGKRKSMYRKWLYRYVYLPEFIRHMCDIVLFGGGRLVRALIGGRR